MSSEKTTQNDKLLSVKEVAQWLSVRPAKVYEMVRQAEGPPVVRIGSLIKFRREAVQRFSQEIAPLITSGPAGLPATPRRAARCAR